MNFKYTLKLLAKYKKYILVTTLLTVLVSQIFTTFQKEEYKSITTWLLEEMELSSSSSFDKNFGNAKIPQSINMAKYSQNSTMMEAEILRSEPVTQKIYDNSNLPYNYSKFKRNFTVIGDFSPLLDIRIYSNTKEEILKILEETKLISLETLKVPAEAFHKKNIATLEKLAEELKDEFIESQVNLKETEAQYNTINPMKSAIVFQQNLKKYERAINKTEEELQAVEVSYKDKLKQLKISSIQEGMDRAALAGSSDLVNTKLELDNERIKLINLQSVYTNEHKEVKECVKRIALLEEELHKYYEETLKRKVSLREMNEIVPFTPLQAEITMQLIDYNLEMNSLKEELKVYKEIYEAENSKLYSAAEQKHILTTLNSIAKLNILKLNLILNLITSELINLGLSKNNYLIYELKEPFIKKIAPNYLANIFYAAGFGLLISFYMILILEKLNTKINSCDYISNTNLKIISQLTNTKDLLNNQNIDNKTIEEYLSIKLHINELHNNLKNKVFSILPTTKDNSNSILITNLAYSIAKNGAKTLLIDLDLEKPQISKLFQIDENTNDIASYLKNEHFDINDIILKSEDTDNLDIIISQKLDKINREILLSSNKLQNTIDLLKQRYEYIFINLSNSRSINTTRLIDNNLVLIKLSKTSKEELNDLIKHSKLYKLGISGCIIEENN